MAYHHQTLSVANHSQGTPTTQAAPATQGAQANSNDNAAGNLSATAGNLSVKKASRLSTGKVVCVGRNYADHARELGNDIPAEPLLFIKPATAVAHFGPDIVVPGDQGACHYELEIALLIGSELKRCNDDNQALAAIDGVGLGLDLTLRDIQNTLKEQGHPWERAKAFDGSCPLTPFVDAKHFFGATSSSADDCEQFELSLALSCGDVLRQQGNASQMLFSIPELLRAMSHLCTLVPGDVVLTGTPAGVGALSEGDHLTAVLAERFEFTTTVRMQ